MLAQPHTPQCLPRTPVRLRRVDLLQPTAGIRRFLFFLITTGEDDEEDDEELDDDEEDDEVAVDDPPDDEVVPLLSESELSESVRTLSPEVDVLQGGGSGCLLMLGSLPRNPSVCFPSSTSS